MHATITLESLPVGALADPASRPAIALRDTSVYGTTLTLPGQEASSTIVVKKSAWRRGWLGRARGEAARPQQQLPPAAAAAALTHNCAPSRRDPP